MLSSALLRYMYKTDVKVQISKPQSLYAFESRFQPGIFLLNPAHIFIENAVKYSKVKALGPSQFLSQSILC